MTYTIIVTLTDNTTRTFQYPATDTISAVIAFEDDTSEDAVYAREHMKYMEVVHSN